MNAADAPQAFGRESDVGSLAGDADHQGEMQEVPKIRVLFLWKRQAAQGASLNVRQKIFVQIVQGEEELGHQPGQGHRHKGEADARQLKKAYRLFGGGYLDDDRADAGDGGQEGEAEDQALSFVLTGRALA